MVQKNKLNVLAATALSIAGLAALPLFVGGSTISPSFRANPPYVGPVAVVNPDGTITNLP